jgi:hypothetical protein
LGCHKKAPRLIGACWKRFKPDYRCGGLELPLLEPLLPEPLVPEPLELPLLPEPLEVPVLPLFEPELADGLMPELSLLLLRLWCLCFLVVVVVD